LLIISANSSTDCRQLVSACNAYPCPCFQDSRGRNANIVILLQSRVDQLLKLLVLKRFPPFLVSERFRRGLRCLLRNSSTVGTRNVCARSLIIRPHSAARTQEHNEQEGC
jgi:hypothetical protein